MYAKLFERRRGVQSAYDGGVPLTTGGGGGGGVQSAYDGGGGGCSRQVTLINSSLTCTHSLLKHKKHHGKRVHSAPALSCSTASLTFVRTTELSGLLSMAQHVICRSLSSGRGGGGGAAKAARGRHFIRDGGGGRPPQGYAGSGAGVVSSVGCRAFRYCIKKLDTRCESNFFSFFDARSACFRDWTKRSASPFVAGGMDLTCCAFSRSF